MAWGNIRFQRQVCRIYLAPPVTSDRTIASIDFIVANGCIAGAVHSRNAYSDFCICDRISNNGHIAQVRSPAYIDTIPFGVFNCVISNKTVGLN